MKQKASPVIIGIAVVVVLLFGFWMYKRSAGGGSPEQLPSPNTPFKPGYSGGSSPSSRPAQGGQ